MKQIPLKIVERTLPRRFFKSRENQRLFRACLRQVRRPEYFGLDRTYNTANPKTSWECLVGSNESIVSVYTHGRKVGHITLESLAL